MLAFIGTLEGSCVGFNMRDAWRDVDKIVKYRAGVIVTELHTYVRFGHLRWVVGGCNMKCRIKKENMTVDLILTAVGQLDKESSGQQRLLKFNHTPSGEQWTAIKTERTSFMFWILNSMKERKRSKEIVNSTRNEAVSNFGCFFGFR